MSKKEEEATAKALGLEEIGDDERQFIFPGKLCTSTRTPCNPNSP